MALKLQVAFVFCEVSLKKGFLPLFFKKKGIKVLILEINFDKP